MWAPDANDYGYVPAHLVNGGAYAHEHYHYHQYSRDFHEYAQRAHFFDQSNESARQARELETITKENLHQFSSK